MIEPAGAQWRAVYHGVIKNPPQGPHSAALLHLRRGLEALIASYQPDEGAIEGVFFCRNARTALTLGEARGVVLAVFADRGVPVFEYAPATIKRSLTGRGAAEKEQVGRMVVSMLNLEAEPSEDAADALATALCHVHAGLSRRLGQIHPV